MSYLTRLKAKIAQDVPEAEATKVSQAPYAPFVATESTSLVSNFAENNHLHNQSQRDKASYEERAAIMQYDGLLDRESAEQCAHAIVFCKDCLHHIPQPDSVSRSGNTHATPSGCKLGLVTPDSWPPIYSFTGWGCPRHTKIIKGLVVTAGQA